jgi:putative hydrolase
VPANVAVLAEGLERPIEDVRLFLALREAAHHRLFAHVPWLKQQLIDSVDAYGRGISIDPDAIASALSEIDPTNPESLQSALAGGLFQPQNTDAQNVALKRLETLLALIEGWVDCVVMQASRDRMQGAEALAEAMRRRRAAGGPAEQTFATLVGLELRPRRLRDAAALWTAMTERHSSSVRDGLWNHPDLLPSAEDLDDPNAFAALHGTLSDDERSVFDELARLAESDESAEPAARSAAEVTGEATSQKSAPPPEASDPPNQSFDSEGSHESDEDKPGS